MLPPVALTVAGSDSGGGAGIQADLKTFAFHGVYGVSAITCVTAQNTVGVHRVDAIPPEGVIAQVRAVREDFPIASAKLGMLLGCEIIEALAAELDQAPLPQLVLDPVMVARSGDRLINEEAITILIEKLLPHASIVTPNVAEAEILAKMPITDVESMKVAARRIAEQGARAVLITGGSLPNAARGKDVLFCRDSLEVVETRCIQTRNTHGTGCTLSAAIAAQLALGGDLPTVISEAKAFVTGALAAGLSLGKGPGPIRHDFRLQQPRNEPESP